MKDFTLLAAIPLFLSFILVECFLITKNKYNYSSWKDSAANFGLGVGHLAQGALFAGFNFAVFKFIYSHRIFTISKTFAAFVVFFFLEDLAYYAFHRVSHESRLWWAAHETHHSSEHYNFTTAFRQSWTGSLHGWVFWAPLAWIGFPVEWIFLEWSVSLIYQFFLHTQLIKNFGPLDWVLNSPSHHRAHHGRDPIYLDKNYGGILIIWDRLFGTFVEESIKPKFGVTKPVTSYLPWVIAFQSWGELARDLWQARSFKERLQFTFKSPAWLAENKGRVI